MTRLSRQDWLEQGLYYLAEQGVDALTIDAMCQLLNVTKGSFYHHFANRQAFLEAILNFWEAAYTQQFIAFSQEALTPQEQMARLMQRVSETYGHQENAIRAWAQTDPMARVAQERVDQQRLHYLITLQQALYGNADDARALANLYYTALIGSSHIMPALNVEDLERMYQLLARLSSTLPKKDTP